MAWIFGWATAIYLPSALIALAGLSPEAAGKSFLAGIFAVADEVAPAAKIGFAILFAGSVLLAGRLAGVRGRAAVAADMLAAVLAMLLVLALLPPPWSRGFGIGLTGARFAPQATMIYLAGALLAGLVFSLSAAKCARRTARPVER
ncbi:MAG: hypothetical protein ACXWUR_03205 [Allosphingosinicella sp.]